MSGGSKRVRKHNRERGPYPLTASPSDGPGVGRFWPPAIDASKRCKRLAPSLIHHDADGFVTTVEPLKAPLLILNVVNSYLYTD